MRTMVGRGVAGAAGAVAGACLLVVLVASFLGRPHWHTRVTLAAASTPLHDEKVAQLFREEAEDAAEAAAAVEDDEPSRALKLQTEASKAAAAAEHAEAAEHTEQELPAGYHVLKPGHTLPKGAILEPFSPRLASGYHVLKPGMKLPKGARIVKHPPVRMRAGTLRHRSRKRQMKATGGDRGSVLDDVRAGLDAAGRRASSEVQAVQGEAQALMREAHVHGVFR